MADGSPRTIDNATEQQDVRTFFQINGRYVVAPDSAPDDLLNDIGCLAECAEAGLQAVVDGISDEGSQMAANPKDAVRLLYGVLYQVQMMANLAGAACCLLPRAEEVRHG